jgi:hypothetical protein
MFSLNVIDKALRYGDVWGGWRYRCIVLGFSIRRKGVVRFTHWPLYPLGKEPPVLFK